MLLITDAIFSAMVNHDKNQLILKYLLCCDPPSYACRRYFDWFEPHFILQIQKCSENLNNASNQEEFEICIRIHANIEKLKNDYSSLFQIKQGNETEMNGRSIPEPYTAWKITKE